MKQHEQEHSKENDSIIRFSSKSKSNNSSSIKSNEQENSKENDSIIRFSSKSKSNNNSSIKSNEQNEIKNRNIDNIERVESDTNNKENEKEQNIFEEEEEENDQELEANSNSESLSTFDLAPSKKILEMRKELARLLNNRQRDFASQQQISIENNQRDKNSTSNTKNESESDENSFTHTKPKQEDSRNKETEEESDFFIEDKSSGANSPKKQSSPNRQNSPIKSIDDIDQIESSEIVESFQNKQINNNKIEESSISQTTENKSFSGLIEVLKEVSSGSSFAPKQIANQKSFDSFDAPSFNDEQQQQRNDNKIEKPNLGRIQKEREIQINPHNENSNEMIEEESSENPLKNSGIDEIEDHLSFLSSIVEEEAKQNKNDDQKENILKIEDDQQEKQEQNVLKIEDDQNEKQDQKILKIEDDHQQENIQRNDEDKNENDNQVVLQLDDEENKDVLKDDEDQNESEYEEEVNDNRNKVELKNIQNEQENEEEDECQICLIKPEDIPGIKPNMFPPFRLKKKKSSDYDDDESDSDDSDDSDQIYPTFDQPISKKKSALSPPYYKQTKSTKYPITSLNVCIVEASLQTAVSSFVQLGVRENSKGKTPSRVNDEDTVMTKIVSNTFLPRYNERFNVPIDDPETDELSLKVFAVSNSSNSSSPKQSIISQVYVATNMFPLNQEVAKTFKMTPAGQISLKVTAESELYNEQHPKMKDRSGNKAKEEDSSKLDNDEETLQIKIDLDDDDDKIILNKNNTKNDDDKVILNKNNTKDDDDKVILNKNNIIDDDDKKFRSEYSVKYEYEYVEEDEDEDEQEIEITPEKVDDGDSKTKDIKEYEEDIEKISAIPSALSDLGDELNTIDNFEDDKKDDITDSENNNDTIKDDDDDDEKIDGINSNSEEEEELAKLSPVNSGFVLPEIMNLKEMVEQDDDDFDF